MDCSTAIALAAAVAVAAAYLTDTAARAVELELARRRVGRLFAVKLLAFGGSALALLPALAGATPPLRRRDRALRAAAVADDGPGEGGRQYRSSLPLQTLLAGARAVIPFLAAAVAVAAVSLDFHEVAVRLDSPLVVGASSPVPLPRSADRLPTFMRRVTLRGPVNNPGLAVLMDHEFCALELEPLPDPATLFRPGYLADLSNTAKNADYSDAVDRLRIVVAGPAGGSAAGRSVLCLLNYSRTSVDVSMTSGAEQTIGEVHGELKVVISNVILDKTEATGVDIDRGNSSSVAATNGHQVKSDVTVPCRSDVSHRVASVHGDQLVITDVYPALPSGLCIVHTTTHSITGEVAVQDAVVSGTAVVVLDEDIRDGRGSRVSTRRAPGCRILHGSMALRELRASLRRDSGGISRVPGPSSDAEGVARVSIVSTHLSPSPPGVAGLLVLVLLSLLATYGVMRLRELADDAAKVVAAADEAILRAAHGRATADAWEMEEAFTAVTEGKAFIRGAVGVGAGRRGLVSVQEGRNHYGLLRSDELELPREGLVFE
ncbi:hypothetical protein HK405_008048 [Cladochytrium tenue]|nr:hypothetical protein HK405_008048 [Cladochytrium tenue]